MLILVIWLMAANGALIKRVHELEEENEKLKKEKESLNARLNQDSSNSDRPPSTNSPYKRKPPRKGEGKPGARKGHTGYGQANLDPTKIVEVKPKQCECGNTDFPSTTPFYTHQHIELPRIEMEIIHFILHQGECPVCGRFNKASLPKEYEPGYGPRLTALIADLSVGNSRGRVKAHIESVFKIPISRGAIQRSIDRASEAILPHYETIGKVARAAKVNNLDETPWFHNGILMWLWVMVNPYVAYFKVLTSRSKEAFEALIEKWAGVLVSDGYGVYRKWVNRRQTCLAHLLRAAKGLSQRTDEQVARLGARAHAEIQRLLKWAHAPPTKGEARMWYARLAKLISVYRDRKDEAGTFARRLEREMGHLWVFLLIDGVDPTNNRAERTLRFAVLWRKMMQGTSSDKGDRWAERILSLRETCKLKGKSSYEVLVDALTAYYKGEKPDLSWIEDDQKTSTP